MSETTDQEQSLAGRLRNKVQDVHSSISEAVTGVSEAGVEKIKGAVEEVNTLLPLIAELGYTVDGVNFCLGLIPDVTINIGGLTRTMDEALYQRILGEHREDKILCGVLMALQTASAMQARVHIMGMKSDTASITIGVPPKMSMHFRKSG